MAPQGTVALMTLHRLLRWSRLAWRGSGRAMRKRNVNYDPVPGSVPGGRRGRAGSSFACGVHIGQLTCPSRQMISPSVRFLGSRSSAPCCRIVATAVTSPATRLRPDPACPRPPVAGALVLCGDTPLASSAGGSFEGLLVSRRTLVRRTFCGDGKIKIAVPLRAPRFWPCLRSLGCWKCCEEELKMGDLEIPGCLGKSFERYT